MMTSLNIKIKEEPPDEELSAILDNEIQLSSVDKDAEGLITQQIEEILPNNDESYSEEEEEEEEEYDKTEKPKRHIPCRICDFKAKTNKELKRHEARHAIKGWYHECRYCDYITYIRQRLQEHEAKHTNSKPFRCKECEFRTRFRADLYKHRAKHSTVKKFSCPQCDFKTKWCRNIKHHLLKHSEARPHGCHICGFRFKRIQDLKYHLYRHNDVKPIRCEICDFRCKTNYELKCHKLKHSDIREFSCTFPGCLQKTKTKSDLTKHMRTHNKENNFLCAICGKGFNTAQSLNKHKDRHSNVRKFKCALCEKWFKNKPSLRAHMKIHSGVKPYQCDVCLRTFLNKYNMVKHKETHTGDRPYLCPICPYGARISDHLLAHIGSMHGDSHAYFCELCRKPFKRYSQLQVHIKRMHKNVKKNFDRNKEGKIDIKLESDADGVISTGSDVFSVKRIGEVNFEPDEKRKRGRPRKIKVEVLDEDDNQQEQLCLDGDACEQTKITDESTSETSSKLATYQDGFRLPLATKGFQFNFDKTGKKPRSWFMHPENMFGNAADKQRAYMAKKERFLDKMNSGRIPRVRKKSDVVYNCMMPNTGQKESEENDSCHTDHLESHRLLISGRTKLKTMRKIKRRIRHIKESMKGSPLLEDPVPSHGVQEDAGSSSDEEDMKENQTEDEDDLPLSQLRLTDSVHLFNNDKTSITSNTTLNHNVDSGYQKAATSNDLDVGGSHIKLVLKRKKTGTFKVTVNTSNMPNVVSAESEKTAKNLPSLVSDVYNGSVRILSKSLQPKAKSTKKSTKSKEEKSKSHKPKLVVQKNQKEKKKQITGQISHSKNSPKTKTVVNSNKKSPSATNPNEKIKTTKKSKSSKPKSTKSPSKTSKSQSKTSKSPSKASKSPKSKKSPPKTKTPKPKANSKGKKSKNCSTEQKSQKENRNKKKTHPQRSQCHQQTYEEFPIKLEPADDGYESSYRGVMSEEQLLEAMELHPELFVKLEPKEGLVDHLPQCPGSSHCLCGPGVVKEEQEHYPEPTRYLYDGRSDDNVGESYNEHAIAWGLREGDKIPKIDMLKSTTDKNAHLDVSHSSSNPGKSKMPHDNDLQSRFEKDLSEIGTTAVSELVNNRCKTSPVYSWGPRKDNPECLSPSIVELSPLASEDGKVKASKGPENIEDKVSDIPVSYVYTF